MSSQYHKNFQASQFVKDFLFTDLMNHVEFLKWMDNLDKDNDDLLLIGILERMLADTEWHDYHTLAASGTIRNSSSSASLLRS